MPSRPEYTPVSPRLVPGMLLMLYAVGGFILLGVLNGVAISLVLRLFLDREAVLAARTWIVPLSFVLALAEVALYEWNRALSVARALDPEVDSHPAGLWPTWRVPLAVAACVAAITTLGILFTGQRPDLAALPQPAVYRCQVDAEGRVIQREPMGERPVFRSGDRFQIQFDPKSAQPGPFALFLVGPTGTVELLYSTATAGDAGEPTVILPDRDRTFEFDESSGWEGLIVLPGKSPEVLLAQVKSAVAASLQGTVRSPNQKLTLDEFNACLDRLRQKQAVQAVVVEHLPR